MGGKNQSTSKKKKQGGYEDERICCKVHDPFDILCHRCVQGPRSRAESYVPKGTRTRHDLIRKAPTYNNTASKLSLRTETLAVFFLIKKIEALIWTSTFLYVVRLN